MLFLVELIRDVFLISQHRYIPCLLENHDRNGILSIIAHCTSGHSYWPKVTLPLLLFYLFIVFHFVLDIWIIHRSEKWTGAEQCLGKNEKDMMYMYFWQEFRLQWEPKLICYYYFIDILGKVHVHETSKVLCICCRIAFYMYFFLKICFSGALLCYTDSRVRYHASHIMVLLLFDEVASLSTDENQSVNHFSLPKCVSQK